MYRPSLTLTFAFLLACALAQSPTQRPPVTGLRGRQYIYCPCSPTKRGYRTDVVESIREYVEDVVKIFNEETREKTPTNEINRELALKSQELWANCVNDYSMEECVNADTALRADPKCTPQCASFCEYDRGSWRNNANGRYGPSCDEVPRWRATAVEINNSSKAEKGDVQASPRNPNPGAEKPLGAKVPTRPLQANGRPVGGSSSIPAGKGEPVVVDTPAPGSGESPSVPVAGDVPATPDTTDGVSTVTTPNATNPESGGDLEGVPLETLTPVTDQNSPPIATLDEGCVAVEHLEGYTLQHTRNLKRTVLCSKGFCATPNHALVVDGKWTSMLQLCEMWECVSTVKMVNNLKVAVNRRAWYGDIEITPYDMRFPRWCIWVVQIGADGLHLVGVATLISAITALFVLVGCAVKEL